METIGHASDPELNVVGRACIHKTSSVGQSSPALAAEAGDCRSVEAALEVGVDCSSPLLSTGPMRVEPRAGLDPPRIPLPSIPGRLGRPMRVEPLGTGNFSAMPAALVAADGGETTAEAGVGAGQGGLRTGWSRGAAEAEVDTAGGSAAVMSSQRPEAVAAVGAAVTETEAAGEAVVQTSAAAGGATAVGLGAVVEAVLGATAAASVFDAAAAEVGTVSGVTDTAAAAGAAAAGAAAVATAPNAVLVEWSDNDMRAVSDAFGASKLWAGVGFAAVSSAAAASAATTTESDAGAAVGATAGLDAPAVADTGLAD